jgi:hypothetical protein
MACLWASKCCCNLSILCYLSAMLRIVFFLLASGLASVSLSQIDTGYSRQCSAIREVMYLFTQQHIPELLDTKLRSSNGYQTNGVWTFSHERYSTRLPWADAQTTEVEHATDFRDTLQTDSWQYIANFAPLTDLQNANRQMNWVLQQINGCVLPFSDSVSIALLPVDPAELPPNKPDNLVDAFLFALPPVPRTAWQLSLMIGLEKMRNGYRTVLIVEWMEELRKAAGK